MYVCCRVQDQEKTMVSEHPILKKPVLKYKPNIELPDSLKNRGITGTVYVECVIDTVGHIKTARIFKSSNEKLNAIALEIAKRYEFFPAEQNHKKVNFIVVIPLTFDTSKEHR